MVFLFAYSAYSHRFSYRLNQARGVFIRSSIIHQNYEIGLKRHMITFLFQTSAGCSSEIADADISLNNTTRSRFQANIDEYHGISSSQNTMRRGTKSDDWRSKTAVIGRVIAPILPYRQ